MKVFRSELLKTLDYYKIVAEKARQIVYYYVPSRQADIVDIELWNTPNEEKVRIEYYSEYLRIHVISVPLKWFELDGDEFTEAIDAYKKKEMEEKERREEEEFREAERIEYERLKRKFEKESEE